ncbi:hypothetical protein [Candidatus Palauibacter sp.]|uniref:hypothetical protein n=1 Tax=Candidatus Palauibacter sp. TaxID=3101350 RepID=UPI003AF2772F
MDSAGLVVAAGEGTTGVTATSGEASGVAAVSVMQAVSTVSGPQTRWWRATPCGCRRRR